MPISYCRPGESTSLNSFDGRASYNGEKGPPSCTTRNAHEEFTFTICARKMEVRRRSHTMEELREDSWVMVVVMVAVVVIECHSVSLSPLHS